MSDNSQQWIEAGYELFAHEGPEGIQVEKLARILGRNKSGFYYHFGDRELFLSELIQYHYNIISQFCSEVARCRYFDPDYLEMLIKYKTSAFVQKQFRNHMEIPAFKEAFNKVRKKTEKEVLPLWVAYIGIPQNHSLTATLWDILRDLFFIRLTIENLTKQNLHELVEEFCQVVDKLKQLAQINDFTPVIPFRNSGLRKQNP
jgi:AcrR family transcriptional regulator